MPPTPAARAIPTRSAEGWCSERGGQFVPYALLELVAGV